MKDKWIFIVNPVAGSGSARSVMPVLEEMIRIKEIDAEIVYTTGRGHAVEISQEFLERGFRYFIGVGGDGTFNEIARPLVNRPEVVAGLVPAGTGNDFVQILGFPNRFGSRDWEVFFNAATMRMDAGSVNGMIFVNGMGLGFDAQVASENYTPEGIVKEGNKYRYIWHILKTLLFFREKKMVILNNGEKTETDCFINTIAVGRRFAGGFLLTPKAIANDGLLDVCSIKKLSLPERLRILMMVPDGRHIVDKRISYYQTPGLRLEFPERVPYHVDGELFYADKFEVNLIPGGINVIYNPEGPHFFIK